MTAWDLVEIHDREVRKRVFKPSLTEVVEQDRTVLVECMTDDTIALRNRRRLHLTAIKVRFAGDVCYCEYTARIRRKDGTMGKVTQTVTHLDAEFPAEWKRLIARVVVEVTPTWFDTAKRPRLVRQSHAEVAAD